MDVTPSPTMKLSLLSRTSLINPLKTDLGSLNNFVVEILGHHERALTYFKWNWGSGFECGFGHYGYNSGYYWRNKYST
jgi:hypothetical protein